MKKSSVLIFSTLFIMTLLGFQNCGYFATELGSADLYSQCLAKFDPIPSFRDGHHKFFVTHSCNNCHSAGGSGAGAFAQTDLTSAWLEFDPRGPEKIRAKLTSGHQSYNIIDLEDDLIDAEIIYDEARANLSCNNAEGPLVTSIKSLHFFEDTLTFGKYRVLTQDNNGARQVATDFKKSQTIVFDLDDGEFEPAIPGAKLSIEVEVYYDEDFFFPTHYQVRNPKILSPTENLKIKGLTIFLNGKDYLVTTFQGLDNDIKPGSSFQELDPGGADAVFVKDENATDIFDKIYDNSDAWSVKFDSLEIL